MNTLKTTLSRCLATLFCTLFIINSLSAQQNSAYNQYIQKFKSLAIEQMQRHRIPASITLSQGLLESAAGKSTLATEAHNHFGIKVGTGWTGPYIVKDDDAKGEHFRKYKTDAESYEDHSQFLKKSRYASLFQLDIRDYKGWARGLKACGYATSPTYAENLISIIENYQLYQYDGYQSPTQQGGAVQLTPQEIFFTTHPVQVCNGCYYIILQPGDDLDTVAKMAGKKKRKLLSYNDLPKYAVPDAGSVVYLEKKKTRGDKYFKGRPHVLQSGQSLYDVAQMYGIRLKNLYKINRFSEDYMPVVGQTIYLY